MKKSILIVVFLALAGAAVARYLGKEEFLPDAIANWGSIAFSVLAGSLAILYIISRLRR